MIKKILLFAVIICISSLLFGCGVSETATGDSSSGSVIDSAGDSTGDNAGGNATLTWPKEYMSNLPVPSCTITDVSKYTGTGIDLKHIPADDTTKPTMVIVAFKDMSKEDATDYVANLVTLGYKGGVNISNEKDILFTCPEITFDYSIADKTGHISYGKE